MTTSGVCFIPENEGEAQKRKQRAEEIKAQPIKMLLDKVLSSIVVAEDKSQIIFVTNDAEAYKMYHNQHCCESVTVDDIEGDLNDLIGSPILQAEESTNSDDSDLGKTKPTDCFTWTFYKLATIKGYVTIRWIGESNGYYSESVDFKHL